jgi:hypothetical protein
LERTAVAKKCQGRRPVGRPRKRQIPSSYPKDIMNSKDIGRTLLEDGKSIKTKDYMNSAPNHSDKECLEESRRNSKEERDRRRKQKKAKLELFQLEIKFA